MPLRFDCLIARLQRTMVKPQPKVALATSRPSAGVAANRNAFAASEASLAAGETPAAKRRKTG